MAISNNVLISDALRELGVIAETQSASAEQASHALRKLNQMMEEWEESDIKLEYFAQVDGDLGSACPIPSYAEGGVMASLAVRIAPTYGAPISEATAKSAADGYALICRKAMNAKLQPVSADRPLGEGQFSNGDILNGT